MSEDIATLSAFSVYQKRCKNLKQSNSQKKKKPSLQQITVKPDQNFKEKKSTKQIVGKKQEVKSKRTLNDAMKIEINGIAKRVNTKTSLHLKNQKGEKNSNRKKFSLNKKCREKYESKKSAANKFKKLRSDLKISNCAYSKEDDYKNPIKVCLKEFEWLIYPLKAKAFFNQHWEQHSIHIERDNISYYNHLISTSSMDTILKENNVLYTKHLDVTSYSNGEKQTLNDPGRVICNILWDSYKYDSCSVRMLNPQIFEPRIHKLNATLQEFFGCFVGCNIYLTPPNSQGFAPHYDDIEAFILQIEGEKRWRLYKPPPEGYLTRYPSRDFKQSEVGEPMLDRIIKAGDLLYIPRGTIHQAQTLETHSLHITLSVNQKNSWYDLLKKLLVQSLKQANKSDFHFRSGLPRDYLRYMGVAHAEKHDCQLRSLFKQNVKDMLTELIDHHLDIDSAADLMAKDHIHDFLPPYLIENERQRTVLGNSSTMTNGCIKEGKEITLDTRIRLLRSHCVRLIKEDDIYKVYFSTENSKEYHEYDLQSLEVAGQFVSAVKKIITCYPKFIRVSDLPLKCDDDKVYVVTDLWEKCLLVAENLSSQIQ